MTSFAFIVGIIVLFLILMAFETDDLAVKLRSRQISLWTWLVSGNWPAKVGSILLIIGIGALMRYALINIDVPPQVKLSVGVLITAFLGYISYLLRELSHHRALHLALAGATCGVAYLTTYSAFGLFGYLDNITGITLLVIVAAVTGAFAVATNALSIAVLAMIGAFMAPAFGLEADPGPLVVYGYYIAISILCLLMIVSKGWRPLIHISFLFTLIGGLFLGWTTEYYQPDYYHLMQPILLILVALHLAMPIMEQRATPGIWAKRFDTGYFIVLSITAAVLTYLISPQIKPEFSIGLMLLGILWTVTAISQYRRKDDSVKYGIVAFLFYTAAAIAFLEDVSYTIFGIFCMTAILTVAVRLKFPSGISSATSFMLVIFIGLWFIESGFARVSGQAFYNTWFLEHIVTALLVFWAAYLHKKTSSNIYRAIFYFVASAIILQAILTEVFRLNFIYIAEVLHLIILSGLFFAFVKSVKASSRSAIFIILGIILFINTWLIAIDAINVISISFVLLDILAFAIVAFLFTRESYKDEIGAIIAVLLMPVFIIPWLIRLNNTLGFETIFFILTCMTATAFISVIFANFIKLSEGKWSYVVTPKLFLILAILLAWPVIFHIERGVWPVLFEVITLAMLVYIATRNQPEGNIEKSGVISVILLALVLQAMLLRLYGPQGVMTIADISQIGYPTVISFIWVFLGGSIAWWGGRIASRLWWSTGSTLMVIAAIKLVFIDFGSLGELGNIIGLIAAGVVFLIVAWLVPIPPKKPTPPPEPSRTKDSEEESYDEILLEQESTVGISRVLLPIIIFVSVLITLLWFAIELTTPESRKHYPVKQIQSTNAPIIIIPRRNNDVLNEEKYYAIFRRLNCQPPSLDSGYSQEDYFVCDGSLITKQGLKNVIESEIRNRKICDQFIDSLPENYVLYAGGNYEGRFVKNRSDNAIFARYEFNVYVNEPGQNVVLALGSHHSSVWNIFWSPGTQIRGIFVSGYSNQHVSGVQGIPILNSTNENSGKCDNFEFSEADPFSAKGIIRRFFNHNLEAVVLADNGELFFGKPENDQITWIQNTEISN